MFVCKYHKNIRLILNVLENYINVSFNFVSFVDQVTSNQSNKDCIYHKCDKFTDLLDTITPSHDIGKILTTYQQRQSEEKRAEKLKISATGNIFEYL